MSQLECQNRDLTQKVYHLKIKRRNLFFICLFIFFFSFATIILAGFTSINVAIEKRELEKNIKEKGHAQAVLAEAYMLRDEISDVNVAVCGCIISDAKAEAEEKVAVAKEKASQIKAKKQNNNNKIIFAEKYKLAEPVVLSDYEFDLLCHLVYAEAGDQKTEGQQAVCWVVLNRLASPKYPNTIYKVIYAPGQFDPVKNGSINKQPSQKTKDAVKSVLSGNVPDMTYGALFFCDPSISKKSNVSWFNTLQKTTSIGCHSFYKYW